MADSNETQKRSDKEIFFEAIEKDNPRERAAYLDAACGADPALRRRVDELLANHFGADGFMNALAVGAASAGTPAVSGPEGPGTVIGRYKLREKIGEGGCGVVYVAEQEEPVRRRVALKVIKLGMDTRSVVARFEAERQALAMMDHPNIAKILDAGVTGVSRERSEVGGQSSAGAADLSSDLCPLTSGAGSGRPYFVMELVRGIKITDYCDQNHLSTRERLDLFIQVCRAVQHAHQKGIIHRDLKPSNILVTLHDGVPVPKVIDFGIAKATEGRLTDLTVYTELHQFIGTPAYMSPEQAQMSGLDIDTRSDIYSLGVLLYELLTGKTPFDAQELLRAGLDEMRRTIREKEPLKPSTRLTRELVAADARRLTSQSAIGNRQSEIDRATSRGQVQTKELIRLLRGDLDWIVMKCLEKDRRRRYETANGLARDIERHLNNEPVVARPPGGAYRIQKFVRRNKVMVMAAALVATTLLLGLLGSVWEAIRARSAERRAVGLENTALDKSQLAETQRQRATQNLYAADINLAQRAVAEDDLARARTLLDRHRPKPGEPDLRGFEWRHLWQLCQKDDAVVLEPTVEWPRRLVVSFDGKLLATSRKDGSLGVVWDVDSRRVLKNLPAGDRALAFAPAEPLLVTGGTNGLKLWDTRAWSARRLAHCHAEAAAAFSGDGRWLVVQGDDLQVWDAASWSLVASNAIGVINYYLAPLLTCSPDGSMVACGSGCPCLGNCEVHLFYLPLLQELPSTKGLPNSSCCLAFTPDSRRLVVNAWDLLIRILDIATGREMPCSMTVPGPLSGMRFSPRDPNLLATAGMDGTVRLWDFASQKVQSALHRPTEALEELAFSPDGSWLAVGGCFDPITIFKTGTRNPQDRAANGPHYFRGLAFSPDSRRLLTLDPAGQLAFWDAGEGEFTPFNHLAIGLADSFVAPGAMYELPVAVSPDLHWLALGCTNGRVRFWDLEAKTNYSFAAHAKGVRGMVRASDGRRLATVGEDQQVRVWAVGRPGPLVSLPLEEPLPVVPWPISAAFSADGRFLAASTTNSVRVWDALNWTELKTVPGGLVLVVKFSPDGRTLVISYLAHGFDRWDTATWTKHHVQAGYGTWDLAFSPDSRRLVSLSEKAIVWDTTSWQELASFQGPGVVDFCVPSPDGNKLALTYSAGGLRLLCAPSLHDIEAREASRGSWP